MEDPIREKTKAAFKQNSVPQGVAAWMAKVSATTINNIFSGSGPLSPEEVAICERLQKLLSSHMSIQNTAQLSNSEKEVVTLRDSEEILFSVSEWEKPNTSTEFVVLETPPLRESFVKLFSEKRGGLTQLWIANQLLDALAEHEEDSELLESISWVDDLVKGKGDLFPDTKPSDFVGLIKQRKEQLAAKRRITDAVKSLAEQHIQFEIAASHHTNGDTLHLRLSKLQKGSKETRTVLKFCCPDVSSQKTLEENVGNFFSEELNKTEEIT